MQHLPTEIRLNILAFLAHDDLAAMARVSREWSVLVLDEHVWQTTYATRFAHRWDQPPLVVPTAARQGYRMMLAAFRRYAPTARDTFDRLVDALENTKAWTLIHVPTYRIDDMHPEVNVYEHFMPTKEKFDASAVSVIYNTRALMPLPLEDLAAILLDMQNRRVWDASLTDVRVLATLDASHDIVLSRHRDGAEFCCLRHVRRPAPDTVYIASVSIDEDENGFFAVPPPVLGGTYKRLLVRPSGFRLQRVSQGQTMLSSVLQLPRVLDRLAASQTFATHRIRLLHRIVRSRTPIHIPSQQHVHNTA